MCLLPFWSITAAASTHPTTHPLISTQARRSRQAATGCAPHITIVRYFFSYNSLLNTQPFCQLTGPHITLSSHGLLTTLAHQLGPSASPSYALEGSVAVAGLGISWLRDNLRLIDSADDSEPIAASVSGIWLSQLQSCPFFLGECSRQGTSSSMPCNEAASSAA